MRIKRFVCWGKSSPRKGPRYKFLHLEDPENEGRTVCGCKIPEPQRYTRVNHGSRAKETLTEYTRGAPLERCKTCFGKRRRRS